MKKFCVSLHFVHFFKDQIEFQLKLFFSVTYGICNRARWYDSYNVEKSLYKHSVLKVLYSLVLIFDFVLFPIFNKFPIKLSALGSFDILYTHDKIYM